MTTAGQGPFSASIPLLTISRSQSPRTLGPLVPLIHQTWFITIIVILGIILIGLIVLGTLYYFKRRKSMAKQLGHMNVPVVNAAQLNAKESLWIDRGWRAADCDKDSSLPLAPQNADYAEVN